jgi:putative PIN family toxin of toxin-antitoxin system
MRVVLDTNVIVSGVFWTGLPVVVLNAAIIGQFEAFTSEELLYELEDVVSRRKFNGRTIQVPALANRPIVSGIREFFQVLPGATSSRIVPNDPDDDAVIACAVAARADYIISGDAHLLSVGAYQGIPICTVEHFVSDVLPTLA